MALSRRVVLWLHSAVLVACAAAVSGCDSIKADAVTPATELPTITFAIGDTWEQVIAVSSAKLPTLRPQDVGTIVELPHKLVFKQPKHEVTFAEAWYFGPALDKARRISNVGIGLYLGAADAEETWRRLEEVDRTMDGAGWQRDVDDSRFRQQRGADWRSLRERNAQSPSGGGGAVGAWYLAGQDRVAWVRLAKTNSPDMDGGSLAHEPRFNVVFYFEQDVIPSRGWERKRRGMPE